MYPGLVHPHPLRARIFSTNARTQLYDTSSLQALLIAHCSTIRSRRAPGTEPLHQPFFDPLPLRPRPRALTPPQCCKDHQQCQRVFDGRVVICRRAVYERQGGDPTQRRSIDGGQGTERGCMVIGFDVECYEDDGGREQGEDLVGR